jgi:hypothetical protein
MNSPKPWRFDGHGINDANGERICKVSNSERCLENQRGFNPKFLADSLLIKEAPTMLDVLERIGPALETAAHLMRLNGSEEEYQLFKQDAELVRETIKDAKEEK